MDSTQDTFTRRMLQRAASVRRSREGSLRYSFDDSRRRKSILQAIGDMPVKIVDVADCRINNNGTAGPTTPIPANSMFAGDNQQGSTLRRTKLRSSDSSISQRRSLVPDFCSISQSTSSNLTGHPKSNDDWKNAQNLKILSDQYADRQRRISDFDYEKKIREEDRKEKLKLDSYCNNNNDVNHRMNGNYNFVNEVMALEKSKKSARSQNGGTENAESNTKRKFGESVTSCENDDDESKNNLNLTQTFNSTSLNLTAAGNSTRDSLSSSSYVKGFELGNVKWRGPLYRASVTSPKKSDQDLLGLECEMEEKTEPFSGPGSFDEPKLVRAIHTRISTPPKMKVEMKTIGGFKKPGVKNSVENDPGNGRPRELSLPVKTTIENEKSVKKTNGKFEKIFESPGSPATPLTAEIRQLDEDIKRLGFYPGFYTPENATELSPPNQIYPNLSKIHFTPTGYTPKKLYQSPCTPESVTSKEPTTPKDEDLCDSENRMTPESNDPPKKIEDQNVPERDETEDVTADTDSGRFVKSKNCKAERNDKFKPNMESTRKSSMTDLSKDTGSPCARESTVSSVTIPPNTSESMQTAGTSSSPNEKNLTLNSTVPYNLDDFLADALGDELYNTTVTYPPSECHEKSISQFDASALISEERTPLQRKKKRFFKKIPMTEPPPQQSSTFKRTMTIYRSFTERIKNKLRPGLRTVPKVVTNDLTNMTVDSGFEDKKIQALLQEANIQQTLMYQANKALNFCRSMKEFVSSTEHVESERLLLVAGLRKAAAIDEIKKLDCEFNNNETDVQSCERGEVVIKDFSLPLKEDILKYEAQTGDFVQWFVVTVSHGATVWATQTVSCPVQSPRIIFNGGFLVPNLSPDFKITVKIYSMKMRRTTFNHDDKYHLNQAEKYSRCPSPKKLILRKSDKSLSPKEVQQIEFTAIRNTSFVLSGMVELYLHDLSLAAPWPLISLLPGSVLRGTIDLSLSCKLHLSVSHAGFLTHGDEAGGLATWNRRWCVLQGQTLRFWNYPCDQEDKEPLAVIDLTNCISEEINTVERSLCAKPRTLMIETVRRRSILDRNSMLLECRLSCTIVRNLLCCDTARDFSQWKSKLNHVISALRDWNVTNRSPDVQVSDL